MNKSQLVAEIAIQADVKRDVAHRVLDATLSAITKSLKNNEQVGLVGFGSFLIREREAREGRNPKTGEVIQINASRTPVFKAGKLLKESVNK